MNDPDVEVRGLLEAIYLKYHHDFRNYQLSPLRRRIGHALAVLGQPSVSRLQEAVLRDAALFARLLDLLTTRSGDLFRDPRYFRALGEHVLPLLATYPSLKVWVAGCGAGHELWSLAILFEEADLHERTVFYATDPNASALRAAEEGIYPLDQLAASGRSYLAAGGKRSLTDYYTEREGGAAFEPRLRKRVVFSDHSLATDSVFSEIHLVSCRNVLLSFNPALEDRAIGLFADALVRGGFLGIGAKESLDRCARASSFRELSRDARIYRRA